MYLIECKEYNNVLDFWSNEDRMIINNLSIDVVERIALHMFFDSFKEFEIKGYQPTSDYDVDMMIDIFEVKDDGSDVMDTKKVSTLKGVYDTYDDVFIVTHNDENLLKLSDYSEEYDCYLKLEIIDEGEC